MTFPSWVTVIPLVIKRFFAELDRHRAEAKQIRREDRLNGIKKDPQSSHAEYFGHSVGRVSITRDEKSTKSD
ncbi:hypothetical protein A6E13_16520 [Aliivibrio fischeri]|nr:hypothetical protein A6E13_16520 [Aliivibrio fischeri]